MDCHPFMPCLATLTSFQCKETLDWSNRKLRFLPSFSSDLLKLYIIVFRETALVPPGIIVVICFVITFEVRRFGEHST